MVIFQVDAKREFRAALLAFNNRERARRFRNATLAVFLRIEEEPHTFPRWEGTDFRRALVPSYRYTVIFREELGGPVVYAIAHQSREPGYWVSRAPQH